MKKLPECIENDRLLNNEMEMQDFWRNFAKLRSIQTNITGNEIGKGIIRIDSEPSGAEVFIDNQSYGITPITITDVNVGSYKYKVVKTGYTEHEGTIEVKEGMLCCDTINLVEKKENIECVPSPGVAVTPGQIPGYILIRERNLLYVFGAVALLGLGLLAGYLLFNSRKE